MLIGVDIGTSASKAVLLRQNGEILASHQESYGIAVPHPGWAEQNPEMWLEKAALCLKKVAAAAGDPKQIHGLAFSGQMHGMVLLDSAGRPLQNAIIWADSRSGREVAEVTARIGRERFQAVTLNRLAAGFALASLFWLKKNAGEILKQAACVLCPKDYVRGRLSGLWGQEKSDASATGCLDVARGDWAWEILDELEIPRRIFPKIAGSTDPAGVLTAEGAALCGLPAGLPLYYGGADSSMAGIGAGLVEEGVLGINIGTGGQVSAVLTQPCFDREYRTSTFIHPLPERWIIQGSTLAAGLSLKWFRENFAAHRDFAELSELAGGAACGADGLLFLPYLTGERTPWYDPEARGIFAGLTLRHGVAELARAVMEGVTLGLEQGYTLLREAGVKSGRALAMGGGARSPVWLQIQADVFGIPVQAAAAGDACVGAALLAGVGAGVYGDVYAAVRQVVRGGGTVYEPRGAFRQVYAERREQFRELYLRNKDLWRMGYTDRGTK